MARTVLYDALGAEIELGARRLPDTQAEIGRERDPWAGAVTGENTPESLARLLRGNAPMPQQMALIKRLLRDDHISACMRNLALSVSRLPWEILPFDDSREAEKDAEIVREFFYSLGSLRKLARYLCYGEFYPFVGAGLRWNRDYRLDGWVPVNPVRWNWDDPSNSIRIQTTANRTRGEELDRAGFVIHTAALEPGTPREGGLWQKVAWKWLFLAMTWTGWVKFAERYGDPIIYAIFNRPEDKNSILDAIAELSGGSRGVFPPGTEVNVQEAQRYGTSHVYTSIRQAAEEGIAKVILGHVLNIEARSGSGTLAGNAAENVSQANKEAVADGLEETIQTDIVQRFCAWHFGEAQAAAGEIPKFELRAAPPKDDEKKAKVYVSVNEALSKAGLAIDPSQIEDEFGVRTVAIEPGDETAPKKKTAAMRRRSVAANRRRLATLDDVDQVSTALVGAAVREFSAKVADIFAGASSIEEGAEILFESYDAFDPTKLASTLRDQGVVANLIGREDGTDA